MACCVGVRIFILKEYHASGCEVIFYGVYWLLPQVRFLSFLPYLGLLPVWCGVYPSTGFLIKTYSVWWFGRDESVTGGVVGEADACVVFTNRIVV
jgi:hypothetical protein